MAGPEELLGLGTAISLSVVFFSVVLMMAKWWPGKAVAVGGRRENNVHEDETMEMRVKGLEIEGDLDSVAALLLSAWTSRGSSRAVTLAHELSKRYPAEAFQVGCPLQQQKRVLDRAPRRERDERDDAGAAALTTPGVSTCISEALAGNAGIGLAPERVSAKDDERGSSSASLTPAENGSSGGGDAIALSATPAGKEGSDERDGGGSETPSSPTQTTPTTDSETTTPWERGWQGPEGFKPPPSSSSSNSGAAAASTPSQDFGPTTSLSPRKREAAEGDLGGSEEEAVVPRNFTVLQLNAFDGGIPTPAVRGGVIKAKEARPIYIALRGEVYDASAGRHLYGEGGEYSEFAGHDISRRVARGIKIAAVHGCGGTSTGSTPLDDLSLEGLDRFEKMTLRGWEDTFKARGYPRVGRVVTPPPPRLFSRAELRAFDGRSATGSASGGGEWRGEERVAVGEGKGGAPVEGGAVPESLPVPTPMPAGYAAQPIYVGVRDKVFDVSFGGSEFYVEGGPYECLAGRDASRVLAKMSMKPEDVEGVLDYPSLNDREEKNLADWVQKLGEGGGGRGYPVVGWIDIDL